MNDRVYGSPADIIACFEAGLITKEEAREILAAIFPTLKKVPALT